MSLKCEKLRTTAGKLGIGRDEVPFVDDERLVRWEVADNCPEVTIFNINEMT
ncbi:MAG: hypothetical protein LBU69_03690 [Deltaproteobacteria bacterium]|jgi:predicted enzyme involved in methoxymalonyl-ACP biosynthesis|nr:hypothetical protein [Deltaproteobacteria bacterium]